MNINQPTQVVNENNLSRSIWYVWGKDERVTLHCTHFLRRHTATISHFKENEWVSNITIVQSHAGRFSHKRLEQFATQVLTSLASLSDTNAEVEKLVAVIKSMK